MKGRGMSNKYIRFTGGRYCIDHVLMLRRDQTHPQQEIMLEFLPFNYFTPALP